MKTETFTKQVPILLEGLGKHMREHSLPLPIDIDIDESAKTVTLRLAAAGSAQQRWLNTVAVDAETNESAMGPIWVKTTWRVRLPDLGLRFVIEGHRMLPEVVVGTPLLSVVSA